MTPGTDIARAGRGRTKADPAREAMGKRKAAVLVIALGPERAGEVFKHLRPDEVDELILEIAALGGIDSMERQEVMEEFFHAHLARDYIAEGGLEYAQSILERAVGDTKALEIINR